jgi:hypothetical protein
MVQFPGMPGYKTKQEKLQKEKESRDTQKDRKDGKEEAGKNTPEQDRPSATPSPTKRSAWSSPEETKDKVALNRDQAAKKAQGFPKPYEAYGDGAQQSKDAQGEQPTQDTADENVSLPDKVGDVQGATTQVGGGEGPWEPVVEPTWKLGQDQVTKKDQGYPRPEEAYEVGPDVQKDTRRPEDVKKEREEQARHGRHVKDDQRQDGDEQQGGSKRENKQQGQDENPEESEDEDVFRKPILHSSQLTSSGVDFKGKRVVVLGGGASAVEAVETALSEGAKDAVMVVRDDKVTQFHAPVFLWIC